MYAYIYISYIYIYIYILYNIYYICIHVCYIYNICLELFFENIEKDLFDTVAVRNIRLNISKE